MSRARARGRLFPLVLVVCVLGGWVIVPAEPARGMLAGALASILTWWAVT